jgi:structural maintenance of chromosome 1
LQRIKDSIVKEEDKVYADFSKKVGVRNIREYEESSLTELKKRLTRRDELATQVRVVLSFFSFSFLVCVFFTS